MGTIYKNISGATAKELITGVGYGTKSITPPSNYAKRYKEKEIFNAWISNTYTSSITVSVYLYAVDATLNERKHRHSQARQALNPQQQDGTESMGTEPADETRTYYIVKNMIMRTGTSVELFENNNFQYSDEYSLYIKLGSSSDTADVIIKLKN